MRRHAIAAILGLFSLALTALPIASVSRAAADEPSGYTVEVKDVTTKVGEHAVMLATLHIRDGYRILKYYRNRVIELSSWDDGVAFDRHMVPAELEDGALVFPIGLKATKPGRHPINGVFRVGYIEGPGEFSEVSLRLIAAVIGTP